jgi:adenylosuccinate synthase
MFTVLTGAQFGDEGKGKIVDCLSKDADIIVRFQGGDNAGHTVVIDDKTFKLHLIPSGIFYGKRLLIGPGVVVNPISLKNEINNLEKSGINISPQILGIDPKTSIVMPYHIAMDELCEKNDEKSNSGSIGTTKRGIGFAYTDKISRNEIKLIDLTDKERFFSVYKNIAPIKEGMIKILGGDPAIVTDKDKISEYLNLGIFLKDFMVDVSYELNKGLREGKKILAEGAQGTFLDVIHGTQRWVTSSNTIAGAASSYLGVSPKKIDKIYGVAKAYMTRVGEGPFPTEVHGEIGELFRKKGREYGTTTNRPRRCGWFDGLLFKKAIELNGYTDIVLTKMDVLSCIDPLKICIGYELDDKILDYPPEDSYELMACRPIFEEMDGWSEEICSCTSFNDFPREAKEYIKKIEEISNIKINMISVGERRDQIISKEQEDNRLNIFVG